MAHEIRRRGLRNGRHTARTPDGRLVVVVITRSAGLLRVDYNNIARPGRFDDDAIFYATVVRSPGSAAYPEIRLAGGTGLENGIVLYCYYYYYRRCCRRRYYYYCYYYAK